jgi:hypothetical protein
MLSLAYGRDSSVTYWNFDRFPYTVVYEVDEHAGPQIYAIAHQHREPGYWSARA